MSNKNFFFIILWAVGLDSFDLIKNVFNDGWFLLSGLSQCKNECVCAQDATKQTLRARYVEKWIPTRPDFRFCGRYLLPRLCEVWFQTNIEHENAYPAPVIDCFWEQ